MNYTCRVISGKGRGKGLGFPTFNLEIPKDFPFEYGVYAAWTWIDNQKYMGAMHFGPIPTFKEQDPTFEVYVLDYEDDKEVPELICEPVKLLRKIEQFSDSEALSKQIALDVHNVRTTLVTTPPSL